VQLGTNVRQAQMRCPELIVLDADLAECQAAQDAYLAELVQWELPVEAHGMGMAYVDLHTITTKKQEVTGLAAELGRRVRCALGDDLQPALGWDHSKFCARAAAYQTPAGRMKLVAKEDEATFLAPLPTTLLPLPSLDLQRLHWLGIDTLGHFALLPASAVWQQFGKPGQLAQRWAQGRDNRPVRNMLHAAWTPVEVEFETPVAQLGPVVEALMTKLQTSLDEWSAELQGCTRLRLELYFINRERRVLELVWLEPVSHAARLRLHLANQMAGLHWPAALDRAVVTQAVTAELPALQLALFAEPVIEPATLVEVAAPLQHRYGSIFVRGTVTDASHVVDERRLAMVTV
jgi:protein ImuB